MRTKEDSEMDKDNFLLFGLTAAALGLSLFILWGPKLNRRSASNCSLVGLQNLGLTCFLNALLQALASCPSFIHWLQDGENYGSVSEALYSVLKLLCYEREPDLVEEVYSPDDLIFKLRGKVWPVFPQEQDPHELFLHLLSSLEEEEQKSNPERAESLLDAIEPSGGTIDFNKVCSHGDVPIPTHRQILPVALDRKISPASPFRGYLASQLSCLKCDYKSAVVYDKFYSLSFALSSKGSFFELQRLLDDFVSAELVEGFVCDQCNRGKAPESPSLLSQASKAIKIGKLPKCLCLHISRTYMDSNGYMYKKESYVDFPEFLNMSRYTHTNSMIREKKARKLIGGSKSSLSGIKFPKGGSSLFIGGGSSDPTLTKFKSLTSNNEMNDSAPAGASSLSSDEELDPSNQTAEGSGAAKNNNNTLLPNGTSNQSEKKDQKSGRPERLYRLKAVVEHRGTADSGHFVTYRRGPLRSDIRHRSRELMNQSESRWFFTSDEIVKKSTLCDAMYANAYLLFYERCSTES